MQLKSINIELEFEKLICPHFPEALLRGALGYEIKKISCIYSSKKKDCGDCPLYAECLFGKMFTERGKTYNGLQISPFSVFCEIDTKDIKKMNVNFVFFEPLFNNYKMILYAFVNSGENGVGKERVKFRINSIKDNFSNEVVHSFEKIDAFEIVSKDVEINFRNMPEKKGEYTIEFTSPLRLIKKGKQIKRPALSDIVKFSMLRLRNLESAFDEEVSFHASDFKYIESELDKVKTLGIEYLFSERKRYSTKQQAKITNFGVVGKLFVDGNIEAFFDLLTFAGMVGIGKNTTFGYGNIELLEGVDNA